MATPCPIASLSWPTLATLWCAMVVQACIVDTTSSQDLTCTQESQRQGDRVCQGGVWVQDASPVEMRDAHGDMPDPIDMSRPDLAMPDMPDPVDLPAPVDMPGDMPVPVDMQCPPPDPVAACQAQMKCDGTITLPQNECGEVIEITCGPTCAQGTCVQTECITCPTTAEAYCTMLAKKLSVEGGVCGTWSGMPLESCAVPGGADLSCACADGDSCAMAGGQTGTCQACVPQTLDALAAGLPPESCAALQVDDGCRGTATLSPVDTCEAFESCSPSSLMHLGQVVSTCQPDPAVQLPMPTPAPSASAEFGTSMAIDGDLLAIGAPDDSQGNVNGTSCGSVYVYERNPTTNTWAYQDQLVLPNDFYCNSGNEEFGLSVAVVEDAGSFTRLIAVGAPGDGAAGRVFFFSDDDDDQSWTWLSEAVYDGNTNGARNDARYGESVAMMLDPTPTAIGNGSLHIAIGAPEDRRGGGGEDKEGIVYSYRFRNNDNDNGDDDFERFVLDTPDNQANGNYGENVLFRETRSTQVRLVASQPDYIISGNREHGSIHVSDATSAGTRVNLSNADVGLGPDGDDEFGSALASDGTWLAVGSPLYTLGAGDTAGITALISDTMPMTLNSFVQASNAGAGDRFGEAVAISHPWLMVGAPYEDGDGDNHENTGAVYLYKHDGTTWQPQHLWRAPSQPDRSYTGWSAAITPQWSFYGAPDEESGRVYMIPLTP